MSLSPSQAQLLCAAAVFFATTNVSAMASPSTTPPAKRKRSPYSQKYSEKWENDVKFEGWLSKSSKGSLFIITKLVIMMERQEN